MKLPQASFDRKKALITGNFVREFSWPHRVLFYSWEFRHRIGSNIAEPSCSYFCRTISSVLTAFRNCFNYHWKEHETHEKYAGLRQPYPPSPMSCWRKTSVRNVWYFLLKKCKDMVLKGLIKAVPYSSLSKTFRTWYQFSINILGYFFSPKMIPERLQQVLEITWNFKRSRTFWDSLPIQRWLHKARRCCESLGICCCKLVLRKIRQDQRSKLRSIMSVILILKTSEIWLTLAWVTIQNSLLYIIKATNFHIAVWLVTVLKENQGKSEQK